MKTAFGAADGSVRTRLYHRLLFIKGRVLDEPGCHVLVTLNQQYIKTGYCHSDHCRA